MLNYKKTMGIFMIVAICATIPSACTFSKSQETSVELEDIFKPKVNIVSSQNQIKHGKNIIYAGSKSSNDGFKDISFEFDDLRR